jgi:hypothetical protein
MNDLKRTEDLVRTYQAEGKSNAVEAAVRHILKPNLLRLTSITDYNSLETSLSFKRRLLDIVSSTNITNGSGKDSKDIFDDIEILLDMAIECTEISPHLESALPML